MTGGKAACAWDTNRAPRSTDDAREEAPTRRENPSRDSFVGETDMAATYEIVDGEDPLRALLDACDRELGAFVVQKYGRGEERVSAMRAHEERRCVHAVGAACVQA